MSVYIIILADCWMRKVDMIETKVGCLVSQMGQRNLRPASELLDSWSEAN